MATVAAAAASVTFYSPPSPIPNRCSVRDDLEFLRRTWKRMQAILRDAEEVERLEPPADLWLGELRDLCHAVGDVLDLYDYELLRVDREVRDPSPSSSMSTSSSSCGEIDLRVRGLKGRVDSVLKKRGGVDDVDEGDEDWIFEINLRRSTSSVPPMRDDGFLGREADLEELILLLLSDDGRATGDNVPVIAVVGIGGVGKTTLAQHIYRDPRVRAQFHRLGWVCVSADFDIVRVTREAAESLAEESYTSTELNQNQNHLAGAVERKRILLVLDDVWSESGELWDRFKGPLRCSGKGSKILATTRDPHVASAMHAMASRKLGCLSEEDSWSLFESHAFGSSDPLEEPALVVIGHDIVKKCSGLPLAVRILGGLLRHERDEKMWSYILESGLWEVDPGEREIMGPLQLSYLCLPSYLKACFLFCAVFSKDQAINKKELVQLWMAEDLVQDEKGKQSEDIGMEYIDDLISRSFFSVKMLRNETVDQELVLIHDLIHDLAQQVSREERYMMGDGKLWVFSPKLCYASIRILNKTVPLPPFHCTTSLHTLFVFNHAPFMDPHRNAFSYECLDCLRVLNLRRNKSVSVDFVVNLKLLRYLDLSFTNIDAVPQSICALFKLQVLDLRGTSIKELPRSFGSLEQLRYLDIGQTQIKRLPSSFSSLKQLRLLDITDTRIRKVPESICMLSNLQTFSTHEDLPSFIGNLKCLRKISIKESTVERLPESVCALTNLKELDISCSDLHELPRCIGNLTNLHVLDLWNCDKMFGLPAGIGKLTKLRTIKWFPLGTRSEHAAIAELKDLVNLNGHLSIIGLRNVTRTEDANVANLGNKEHIGSIELKWAPERKAQPVLHEVEESDIHRAEQVLDRLRPHANLKFFYIVEYPGSRFPLWNFNQLERMEILRCKVTCLQRLAARNLVIRDCPNLELIVTLDSIIDSLEIEGCNRLQYLPSRPLTPFEMLTVTNMPSLSSLQGLDAQELVIINCPNLESIDFFDFCPDLRSTKFTETSTRSLQIHDCSRLRILPSKATSLPSLETLRISRLPSLTSLPPCAVEFLEIHHCHDLESIAYLDINIDSLDLKDCAGLSILPPWPAPFNISTFRAVGCPLLKQWYLENKDSILADDCIFQEDPLASEDDEELCTLTSTEDADSEHMDDDTDNADDGESET